ncbi:MAG: choice-of-anchor L domain-containing protein, partial [Flavobacteriaceae bacterium]|nr:choice-of-anchor L domain-containing protein [Flavobacteriaceae bacterium]
MLRSLLVFIFLIGSFVGFSQDINWPQAVDDGDLNATDEIISCEGSITATNQGDFNLENESFQITICPDNEDSEEDLIVFLSNVSVEWPGGLGANPNFFFRVHDGDSTAGTIFGNSTPQNAGIPAGIVASDNSETGCLTIVFQTGSYVVPGFPPQPLAVSFDFGCRLPCQTIVPQLISIEADEFCSDEDAETPTIAPGTDITFTADAFTSNDSNFDDLTFEWNFNGNILTGSEITTSFNNPGLVQGTLTVIDEFLCESNPLTVNVIIGDNQLYVSDLDEDYNLVELISDVMVGGGECANVNNVNSPNNAGNHGSDESIGYFSRGCSDFPFNEGLVIGSGYIESILTPAPATSTGAGIGWQGDPLMTTVASGTSGTQNATVIEFEFSAFEDTASFNYIFASYEYPNFICGFADPFAFIISGPFDEDGNFIGDEYPAGTPGVYEDTYDYNHDANPNNALVSQNLGGLNIATIEDANGNLVPTTPTNTHDGDCGPGQLGEFTLPNTFGELYPPYHGINGETRSLTATAEVIPCQMYKMKLMIADYADAAFDSYVFIEGGSFNIGADLGDDITLEDERVLCWGEDNTQILEIFGGVLDDACDISLEWFLDGEALPEFDGMASIEVSESGIYEVFVGGDGGCNDSDSILVQFLPQAEYETPFADFSICGSTGTLPGGLPAALDPFDYLAHNGIGRDIPEDAENMADLGFEVTYFENFEDAENFENPIEDPEDYQLPDGNFINTICVRVNENFTGERQCPTIECFDLISFEEPEIQETEDLIDCGDFSPASQIIDLTENNPTSIGVQQPAIVETLYYITEADAIANENAIENPTGFTLPQGIEQQTIYIRAQNTGAGDCFDVSSFEVGIYNVEIGTNPLPLIEECEEDGQGNGTFNLTQQNPLVLGENQSSQDYSISYFEDLADANGGTNPINQPSEYFGGAGAIFVRIQNNNNPDCFEVGQFELGIIESAAVNLEVGPIEACDNNNDGFFHEFDLDILIE